MKIINAKTAEDIERAREAILEFRPNVNPEKLVEEVQRMMKEEFFELVYVLSDDGTKAAGFTGYRTLSTLRTGPMIYIDDLFTFSEYRGRGYAGALLDYVDEQAKARGIATVHLDSGFALHPAHRLYLSKRFVLACHHFAKQV